MIDLRNQLLQNRITLYQALGGDFGADIAAQGVVAESTAVGEKSAVNEHVVLAGASQ